MGAIPLYNTVKINESDHFPIFKSSILTAAGLNLAYRIKVNLAAFDRLNLNNQLFTLWLF